MYVGKKKLLEEKTAPSTVAVSGLWVSVLFEFSPVPCQDYLGSGLDYAYWLSPWLDLTALNVKSGASLGAMPISKASQAASLESFPSPTKA